MEEYFERRTVSSGRDAKANIWQATVVHVFRGNWPFPPGNGSRSAEHQEKSLRRKTGKDTEAITSERDVRLALQSKLKLMPVVSF